RTSTKPQRSARGLFAFLDRDPGQILGSCVICAGTDNLAVDALFDYVSGPAASAADHENWREHLRRYAHHVIARRAVPVEVGKHFLLPPHNLLEALGNIEQLHISGILTEPLGHLFYYLIARVGDGIDRMAEAD